MDRPTTSRVAGPASLALALLVVLTVTSCSTRASSTGSTGESTGGPSPSASARHHVSTVGFNPPGPASPTVPDDVGTSVKEWWPLLHQKSCRTLITRTTEVIDASPSKSTEAKIDAAHVYRAAGEVCTNQLTAASRDVAVDIEASGWTECSIPMPAVSLQRWVRLMIKALRGDQTARSAVRTFKRPRCPSESPSPPATKSESPSPSPTP